jgi:hypothetical protein
MPYLIPIGLAVLLLLISLVFGFAAWSDLSYLGMYSAQSGDAINTMIACAVLSAISLFVIWFTLRLARRSNR